MLDAFELIIASCGCRQYIYITQHLMTCNDKINRSFVILGSVFIIRKSPIPVSIAKYPVSLNKLFTYVCSNMWPPNENINGSNKLKLPKIVIMHECILCFAYLVQLHVVLVR